MKMAKAKRGRGADDDDGPASELMVARHGKAPRLSAHVAKHRQRTGAAVGFDSKARDAYVTGFGARKRQRQKQGAALVERRAKQDKLAKRKERREALKEQLAEAEGRSAYAREQEEGGGDEAQEGGGAAEETTTYGSGVVVVTEAIGLGVDVASMVVPKRAKLADKATEREGSGGAVTAKKKMKKAQRR